MSEALKALNVRIEHLQLVRDRYKGEIARMEKGISEARKDAQATGLQLAELYRAVALLESAQ